ncbi:hypothetical protein PVAND_016201 [Polypedilum vanderplanki]|uniref:Uncharacterized protein n=1 Tax=Polypedilum vanderplanki TaxID=319348 RepID=A0A9J6BFH6_POLVA|nr:hypothetical protein PVAND_016201 [Polypedilum vanderplanki]QLB38531.1 transmembrane protein LIL6 [Polypedilum vanderplanki]
MAFANFFKFDNFLGIFKLESGGTIIGAIGLFYALFQFVMQTISFFSILFIRDFCPQKHFIDDAMSVGNLPNEIKPDIKNITTYAQEGLQNITHKVQEGINDVTGNEVSCTFVSKIPFIIVLSVLIAINLVSMIAHYRLIKGVEEFDPRKFELARGFYLFFIVVRFILMVIAAGWTFFSFKMIYLALTLLILLLIDFYIYSIIDSLQDKYENSLPLNVATQNIHMKTVIGQPVDSRNQYHVNY